MAVKKKTGGRTKPAASKAPAKKRRPAVKKASPPRKTRKKTAKPAARSGLIHELKKIGLGIAILLAICMTTAMIADILLKSGSPVDPGPGAVKVSSSPGHRETVVPPEVKKRAVTVTKPVHDSPKLITKTPGLMKKTDQSSIVYEVFEGVAPEHTRKRPVGPAAGDKTPKIAIIIDDIGYDKQLAMALFEVDPDITFSVLPFSPFGKTIAGRLAARGAEIMLHLPMEPTQYPRVNPGPGALLASMSPDALLAQLRKDLDAVPGVKGVNNHMGSRLTALSDKMNQVFTVLKKEDLFFIDSKTAPDSKGEASARLFRLKFSHRDIFLDNYQKIDYISGQFRKLLRRAEKSGHAIGIGHPYQATLDTLRIELPKLKGRIQVVPASRLVAIPG
ncbi:MAG: divergent polysaccharide deacetylase family protein [Desulfobacter sp.]|nr:MAG: divergent polysaccharide deacetylase family protein [Desulfobacter sp.]